MSSLPDVFLPPEMSGIHDALIAPLAPAASGAASLAVLAFEDHLLRRFGSAEVIRLSAGADFQILRAKADEVWALLEGAAGFDLEDTRTFSPTRGAHQVLRVETPTRLLVPFGVRLRIQSTTETRLLRIMTHTELEDPPVAETD
jgi:hypothetical protein